MAIPEELHEEYIGRGSILVNILIRLISGSSHPRQILAIFSYKYPYTIDSTNLRAILFAFWTQNLIFDTQPISFSAHINLFLFIKFKP